MCYCNFAIGQFSLLKKQFERHAIILLFKVQISLNHLSSNTNWSGVFTSIPFFVNFSVLSMEFSIRKCLQNRWDFLPDYLVTYSGQKSKQFADKKIKCRLKESF